MTYIEIDTLPNAMSLFRNSHRKSETYFIISLNKIIEMKLIRTRIIFNELK